jgi:hypothetical protein
MLQARISIKKYLYVKNDEVAQHVSLYYVTYLIQHPNFHYQELKDTSIICMLV